MSATLPLIASILLGGLFTIAALLLSLRHVYQHLKHYNRPEFQLHIVRILLMVPIYSTTSWFQLILTDECAVLVLELFRDSYEAYVIYNFVVLLIKFAGGDVPLSRYLENQPRMPHSWPINVWLPPVKPGPEFLNIIRASVLQFVLVKPAGSLLKLYAFLNWSKGIQTFIRFVMYLVNNVSVFLALYGLVMFYHAAHDVLKDHRPLPKFYSVKAVVFFSFWQGVAIQIAIYVGLLKDVEGVSASEQATGLQDILICFEMFIAAVAHYFVFSYKDYSSVDSEQESLARNFLDIFDFRDVLSDARDRLQGGVGFAQELRDGAPISTHDVLDTQRYDYGSVKRNYDQITTSKYPQRIGWDPEAKAIDGEPLKKARH